MFQHSKKDYYSVNVDIALEANQQQRLYETQLHLQQNYTGYQQQQHMESSQGEGEAQMYDSQLSADQQQEFEM